MASRHIVITAHGIRTFGAWQNRLKLLLEKEEPDITVLNYNYGWFSIFAFLIPPTRWLATRAFRRELIGIAKTYPNARVDLVGHSFGTHLICWSVCRLPATKRPQINAVILAGSVLRPGFRWGDLIRAGTIRMLLNECGTHDLVLVLNQLVVLFTGVAGILGFKGLTANNLRNDWHRFGHSGYFRRRGLDDDELMTTRWVPLLTHGSMPRFVDERPATTGYGIWVFLLQNLELAKFVAYVACVLTAAGWYRNVATAQTADLARRLANQSQTVGTEGPRLPESLALAIQSVQTAATDEGSTALRRAIALFPAVDSAIQYVGSPSFISFSPDDALLASAWDARTVHITNLVRHQDTQSFTLDARIQALTWSSEPGTNRLFIYTEDGTFVSATTADLTKTHVDAPRAHTVAIAERDHQPLLGLVLDGFKIQFRTVTSDAVRDEVSHDQPIGVAFRADGRVAATSGYDGRVNIWNFDRSTQQQDVLVHDEPVSVIAFSPDGGRVAFADNFGGVGIRELSSKRDEFQVRLDDSVSALAFSPDGRWLVGGDGRTARLWDCATGRELARMVDEDEVSGIAFSHDGGQVAVAGKKTVRIWSFPTQLPLDPPGILSALTVNDHGDAVYAGDSYGNIDIVTLKPRPSVTHLIQASGQESAVRALSINGSLLMAAFDNGTIRTWRDGTPIDRRSPLGGIDPVITMAVTPDGQTLAAGDWDGSIRIVKRDGSAIPSGQLQHKTAIDALAFVGEQRLAITTAGLVEIWDWRPRPKVIASRATTGSTLAFSSDGKLWLTGDPTGARVLSWNTGTMAAHIDTYGIPTIGVFYRNDEYLLVGSGNRTARRVTIAPLSRSALIHEGCARLRAYYQRSPTCCSQTRP